MVGSTIFEKPGSLSDCVEQSPPHLTVTRVRDKLALCLASEKWRWFVAAIGLARWLH